MDAQLREFHRRRGSRLAVIAPREGAKTTWLTLAYPLRCALEGWEPYTVILSGSDDQAEQYLRALKSEVAENKVLRGVYPASAGEGPVWRTDVIRLRNGSVVKAVGRGGVVRGRKESEHRPSLIILDDCQGLRDVTSPIERERAVAWLLSEVIPAGTADTNFISVGSSLHREAIAVKAQTLPGWTGRTFPAVLSWPERLDLWDEWGRVATNVTDEDRVTSAAAFLEANRAEMDRGGRSYWPGHWPVSALMSRRAEIGPRRFGVEYNGEVGQPEGAEWGPELFDHILVGKGWPDNLLHRFAWYDGAGDAKPGKGDYHALVMLGFTRDGTLHFDADLWHGTPSDACERIDRACRPFRPRIIGVETNFGHGFITNHYKLWLELANTKRPANSFLPPLPWMGYHVSDPKPDRIRLIDAYLSRGQVRVRDTPGGRLLLAQWRDWPHADHDDGPDAAAGSVWLASQVPVGG